MKKGFAKSFILIIALVLIHQLMQHETKACNVAVVTADASATGRPFIWKNRDHPDSYRHEVLYFPEVIPGVGGSLRLMGETIFSSGTMVCTGGSNESGFAIANTTCYESLALESANVNTNLMEEALEECITLADFEEVLGEFTSRFDNKNISGIFAVIDASNGAAIYEMWTNGNGNDIMYRKFNANTGAVTDENGLPFSDINYTQTIGFNNRTNSNHTNGWIDIWSDTPRELRARQLMTEMLADNELSPRNLMREVSKDVCGGDPTEYCTDSNVQADWDYTIDSYDNPNRDAEMYTRFCISRYQTSMGLVIEGAATQNEAYLTTMWVALGEPSLSVFVPYFPAAQDVSKYAFHDTHSNSGYYWDGSSATTDEKANSFLNLIFDCMQANPGGEVDDIYDDIAVYKNNGAGLTDIAERNDGTSWGFPVADTTINYPKLLSLQNWTLPLEDNVFNRTEEYIAFLENNPTLISSEELAGFSNYCNQYVYQNYSHQADDYVLWSRPLPDNGVAPTISSVSTGDGTNFSINAPITVEFSEPMNQGSINEGTFTLSIGTTIVNGSVDYDAETKTAIFTPDSQLLYNTTYTVVLTSAIQDLSGNAIAGNYSWTFTTESGGGSDIDAPEVLMVSPNDDSTGFSVSGNITARFSEPMSESTITEDTFELFNGTTKISGSVTYDAESDTATFNPDSNLAVETVYTVVLSSGITDVAANGIDGGYSWTFTTETGDPVDPTDTIAPTVLLVSPADDSTGISVSRVITAHFSEDMDEDSITENTFELFNGATKIPGTVTYDSDSDTATFTQDAVLAAGTTFKVELSSGITDVAGNGIAGGYSWIFTTSVTVDPPVIDPTGGAKSKSGGDDGCGTAAEASTLAGGARPFMPGLMSLIVTMLFPLSLMMLHRRVRRRNRV